VREPQRWQDLEDRADRCPRCLYWWVSHGVPTEDGFEPFVTVDVGLHVSSDAPLAALTPGRTETIAARPPAGTENSIEWRQQVYDTLQVMWNSRWWLSIGQSGPRHAAEHGAQTGRGARRAPSLMRS
jgi:hypothetical protein